MSRRHVRGHICPGLQDHFDAATYGCIPAATYGCIPRITEEGTIAGCDDINEEPILFCPYCGEKLPEPTPIAEDE